VGLTSSWYPPLGPVPPIRPSRRPAPRETFSRRTGIAWRRRIRHRRAAVRPGGPTAGGRGSIPAALGGAGAGADAGGRLESSERRLAGADALCGAPVAGPLGAAAAGGLEHQDQRTFGNLVSDLAWTSETRPAVGDGTSMMPFRFERDERRSFSICWLALHQDVDHVDVLMKPPMSGTETSIEFATLSA